MAVHLAAKCRVNWQRKRINSPGRCTMRSRVRPTQKPPSGDRTCTQFRWIERSIPFRVYTFFFFIIRGRTTRYYHSESDERERERKEEKEISRKVGWLCTLRLLGCALNTGRVGYLFQRSRIQKNFIIISLLFFCVFLVFAQRCESFFNSIVFSGAKRLQISNLWRIYDEFRTNVALWQIPSQ